jgi:hypothetical protein
MSKPGPPGKVMEFAFMKVILGCIALSLAIATMAVPADAKGCIKGAIVGAIAGHYAHHHAVLGAIGGCVVGHHLAKERERAAHTQTADHPQTQTSGQQNSTGQQ